MKSALAQTRIGALSLTHRRFKASNPVFETRSASQTTAGALVCTSKAKSQGETDSSQIT